MGRRVKYTKEMLEEAVARSTSIAGVLRHLGLKQAGGTQANISRWIRFYGIDISHFRGMAHQKGLPAPNRLHWSEVLTVSPSGANRRETGLLRRALLESGRAHECENCGSGPEWLGSPLALHVDHIDGNPNDSRPDNLRFLCPNCHSQTPTWARSSRPHPLAEPLDPARVESSTEAEARAR